MYPTSSAVPPSAYSGIRAAWAARSMWWKVSWIFKKRSTISLSTGSTMAENSPSLSPKRT